MQRFCRHIFGVKFYDDMIIKQQIYIYIFRNKETTPSPNQKKLIIIVNKF